MPFPPTSRSPFTEYSVDLTLKKVSLLFAFIRVFSFGSQVCDMRVKSEVFVTKVLVKMQHAQSVSIQSRDTATCFHLAEILSFHNAQILNMNIRFVSVAGFQNIHSLWSHVQSKISTNTKTFVICLLKLELKFAVAYVIMQQINNRLFPQQKY